MARIDSRALLSLLFLPLIFFFAVTSLESPWLPDHAKHAPNLFQPFLHTVLADKLQQAVRSSLYEKDSSRKQPSSFQWTTVTAFNVISPDSIENWVVIGGTAPNNEKSDTASVFSMQAAGVVGCLLTTDNETPSGLQVMECLPFQMNYVTYGNSTGPIGASLASLPFVSPLHGAVIVYCDPLWREDNINPSGSCWVRVRRPGQWVSLRGSQSVSKQIKFCTTSRPCGGGFSIDLVQTESSTNGHQAGPSSSLLPSVNFLIGLPFREPTSEVQVMTDLLHDFKPGSQSSGSRWVNNYKLQGSSINFGRTVKWTPVLHSTGSLYRQRRSAAWIDSSSNSTWAGDSLALVVSPSDEPLPSIIAYGYTSEQVYHVRSKFTETGSRPGFGQALDTVQLPGGGYAIIVGAPYQSRDKLTPNVGSVYIMCPDRKPSGNVVIDGEYAFGFFGYSVVRLGDVDGDGIDDVAIGAPGLQPPLSASPSSESSKDGDTKKKTASLVGRVYVFRVLANCTFDPVPVQVMIAPDSQPGDGFGVGLARGIDMDQDGWPELSITSLRTTNAAPYLFTMPKRLRASCEVSIPKASRLATLKANTVVPITFVIRLTDIRTNKQEKIPSGLGNSKLRVHQINPDKLWYERHSQFANVSSSDAMFDSFLFSPLEGGGMQSVARRFTLRNTSIRLEINPSNPDIMTVTAELEALYDARLMHLRSVPLKVAYRSYVREDECATTKRSDPLCAKREQPLIDWDQCVGEFKPKPLICATYGECRADMNLNTETPDLVIPIHWEKSKDPNQQVTFILTNHGPTKAEGIKVELRVTGQAWATLHDGLQIAIKAVNIIPSAKQWNVKISDSQTAALVSTNTQRWVNADDRVNITVNVSVRIPLDSRNTMVGPLNRTELLEETGENWIPGMHVRVLSDTRDETVANNEVFAAYGVKYSPRIQISAQEQPSAIVDNRVRPYLVSRGKNSRGLLYDKIGSKITHTFLIENQKKFKLHNLNLLLDIPVETADGQPLIYLSDRDEPVELGDLDDVALLQEAIAPKVVTTEGKQAGLCTIPSEYAHKWLLLTKELWRFISKSQGIPSEQTQRRVRRDVHPHSPSSSDNKPLMFDRATGETSFKTGKHGRFLIRCPDHDSSKFPSPASRINPTINPFTVQCVRISCQIPNLRSEDALRIRWTGWLWSQTYFNLGLPDVELTSRLQLENWTLPVSLAKYAHLQSTTRNSTQVVQLDYARETPELELTQTIVFTNVPHKLQHLMPFWPIMVGIIIGSFLLILLGVGFYCSGWFHRKQKVEGEGKPKEAKPRESSLQIRNTNSVMPRGTPLLEDTGGEEVNQTSTEPMTPPLTGSQRTNSPTGSDQVEEDDLINFEGQQTFEAGMKHGVNDDQSTAAEM